MKATTQHASQPLKTQAASFVHQEPCCLYRPVSASELVVASFGVLLFRLTLSGSSATVIPEVGNGNSGHDSMLGVTKSDQPPDLNKWRDYP